MSFLDVFDYQLVHRNGDQRGEVVHIEEGKTLLGRSEKCQIHLPTPDISRQHCVFIRTKTQLFVYDLESRNGTKVNREPIESKKPIELRHRDKVQVGRWKFRFLIKDALSGESIPVETVTDQKSKAKTPKNVLSELDAIAEALDISNDEITKTSSIPRDLRTEPKTPPEPKTNEETPAPEKPVFDPKAKRQPIGLPESAKRKCATDPRTAADQTLRKLFGR